METKPPRILVMGEHGMEEVSWEEAGTVTEPVAMEDYFKPVKLSPQAIDQCSKIVPSEVWIKEGLHSWLQRWADKVFSKLSSSQTVGKIGKLKYVYEFDAEGPVLKSVSLG